MKSKTFKLLLLVIVFYSQSTFSQEDLIVDYKINEDNSVDFNYKKTQPGSYFIIVNFAHISNCYTTRYKGVVKSNSGQLFKLQPIDANQCIDFTYNVSYIRGIPNPKVDSLFAYTLPFARNKEIVIEEAVNLGESLLNHERPSKWKVYIVNSHIADTIFCMRKGIVVDIIDQYSNSNLEDTVYTSNQNSITIEHKDGTCAFYSGFKKDGITVKLGQTVYPQTKLGILNELNPNFYQLSFFVFYTRNNSLERIDKYNAQSNYNEYLTPLFNTSGGVEKIESGKSYTVYFDSDILQYEFTRKEKRKYKKEFSYFQ